MFFAKKALQNCSTSKGPTALQSILYKRDPIPSAMKNVYASLFLFFSFVLSASAQVPSMSSLPSASAVIYLDFDGHTVEGTSWNGDGPIVCSGSNLSTTQINEIFNRVAEDYRPFNINITTDSAKFASAPSTKRMRVILTTSSSWYGSAGGVSFNNSFKYPR